MSFWEVRLVSGTSSRNYENVYHFSTADDLPPDPLIREGIKAFHVEQTMDVYEIKKLVYRLLGTADSFVEETIDLPGAVATGSADLLPLWNTFKVSLECAIGRPGIKLYRGMLIASYLTHTQDQIDPAVVATMQSNFDALMAIIDGVTGHQMVVGSANKPVLAGQVLGDVKMRQEHRKRKRSAP